MRLLLVCHAIPPVENTGTPLITLGLATAFRDRGHDVAVAWTDPRWGTTPEVHRVRGDDGITRFRVGAASRTWLDWALAEDALTASPTATNPDLDLVVAWFRPDVVHVVDLVNLPGTSHASLVASGAPVVRHVWNAEDLCALISPCNQPDPSAPLCPAPITPAQCAACVGRRMAAAPEQPDLAVVEQLLQRKHAVARARFEDYAAVVFASDGFRGYVEAALPLDERAVTVPAGVDHVVAVEDRPRRPAHDRPLTFLLLGTVEDRKGLAVLAAALRTPGLADRDDLRVLLAGGGPVDAARTRFAGDPRVTFLGPYAPAELPGLLADADVGLAPSLFETFHRVSREYLAASLPVVGTPAFGIPDVVRDGHNGLLVDVGDHAALATAMVRLLDDRSLLARLAEGARTTELTTVADEATALLELDDRLLAHRGAP